MVAEQVDGEPPLTMMVPLDQVVVVRVEHIQEIPVQLRELQELIILVAAAVEETKLMVVMVDMGVLLLDIKFNNKYLKKPWR